jgi:1,4-dihydroxy-2-naphthoyl-CoA hydrolase
MSNIQVAELNAYCQGTLNTALGIEFTEITKESIKATMPVDERTIQPMGMLNGGASMALVETVASAGANLYLDREKEVGFGLEINGNHCKPAFKGDTVTAIATPIHVGKTTHVWQVHIYNSESELINISRMTMAIRNR